MSFVLTLQSPMWTAGALAGMRQIEQAPAPVGRGSAMPARAPAVHVEDAL